METIDSIGASVSPPQLRFQGCDIDAPQDREWCEINRGGRWRKLRFHDYDEIYRVPGLYEQLFYDNLKCVSPQCVVGLLHEVLREQGCSPSRLRALDVGAGNGMVAEELRRIGVNRLTGLDIIPEARAAAYRDRPGLYEEYLVADLCQLSSAERQRLELARFNCLAVVAALGFGDIPPLAFANAFNLIRMPGYIAFNIKQEFLEESGKNGFSGLIRRLVGQGIMRVEVYRRYRHRLSANGEALHYAAIVATKIDDIPAATFERLR